MSAFDPKRTWGRTFPGPLLGPRISLAHLMGQSRPLRAYAYRSVSRPARSVQRVQILGDAVGDFFGVPKSARRNHRMGGEPTALSARPCRQPDNKRSTFDYRRHWKASRTSLRRRSTRRLKAQLPPRQRAVVDLVQSLTGSHFVLSWVVPTRRTYPSPFTKTVPVGNCLIKTDHLWTAPLT